MPLTHSQIPVHECVCVRLCVFACLGEFVQSSQLVCLWVWAYASVHSSSRVCVCVIVWSVYVCVTVGQQLNRPPAALKHWNSLPCSFFFYVLPASDSVPMKLALLWLVQFALHCKCFLWSLPRASGGQFKNKKETKRDWQIQSCRSAPVPPINHINNSYCGLLKPKLIHHIYLKKKK